MFGKVNINGYTEEKLIFSGGSTDFIEIGKRTLGRGYSIGLAPDIGILFNIKRLLCGLNLSNQFMYSKFSSYDHVNKKIIQSQNPPASIDGTTIELIDTSMGYKRVGFDNFTETIVISYRF